jgi:guanylate kinase
MLKSSKIILVARGGAGKDYLRKKFQARGFKFGVSYTSRPIRPGEKEGEDYFYVDDAYFKSNVHQFYEIDEFNGWKYGRKITDFEKYDVFLMTPRGIKNIRLIDRKKCFIIYLDISREVVVERLTKRKDADSAIRRMLADDKDFEGFVDYDLRVTNPDF